MTFMDLWHWVFGPGDPTPLKKFCRRCGAKLESYGELLSYNEYTGERIEKDKVSRCPNQNSHDLDDYGGWA